MYNYAYTSNNKEHTMIMAHLLHASTHDAHYLTCERPDLGLGAPFKFFEWFFFLAQFSASCSTVLFIETFHRSFISCTERNDRFKTHTSFSSAIFSSIEEKHYTTCYQSPLILPGVPQELQHQNLSPYISATTVVQI